LKSSSVGFQTEALVALLFMAHGTGLALKHQRSAPGESRRNRSRMKWTDLEWERKKDICGLDTLQQVEANFQGRPFIRNLVEFVHALR